MRDPPQGHGTAAPPRRTETRVVHMTLRAGDTLPERHKPSQTVPVRNLGRPGGSPIRCGACTGTALAHAGRRAQRCQGDAPRRPYMPCVQPRALGQRTSQAPGRTGGRGGSRPPTARANPRGSPEPARYRQAMQHPPSPGAARRPLPGRERRLFVASLETGASVLSAYSTERTQSAGNVGATRWVAHKVRRVYWDRVGSCGADVHNGARATHRVAPTSPAYSRVRYANEHGTATGVSVVGAVRAPPTTSRDVRGTWK
jgi:hypothetical protein